MISRCLHCDEPVLATEPFELRAIVHEDGTASQEPIHWECAARMVLGSLAHQEGKCSCHGGTEGDPPEMTRREAAKAALAAFQAKAGRGP